MTRTQCSTSTRMWLVSSVGASPLAALAVVQWRSCAMVRWLAPGCCGGAAAVVLRWQCCGVGSAPWHAASVLPAVRFLQRCLRCGGAAVVVLRHGLRRGNAAAPALRHGGAGAGGASPWRCCRTGCSAELAALNDCLFQNSVLCPTALENDYCMTHYKYASYSVPFPVLLYSLLIPRGT